METSLACVGTPATQSYLEELLVRPQYYRIEMADLSQEIKTKMADIIQKREKVWYLRAESPAARWLDEKDPIKTIEIDFKNKILYLITNSNAVDSCSYESETLDGKGEINLLGIVKEIAYSYIVEEWVTGSASTYIRSKVDECEKRLDYLVLDLLPKRWDLDFTYKVRVLLPQPDSRRNPNFFYKIEGIVYNKLDD